MVRDIAVKLRRKAGMTQPQLADALGISAVYVRKIERGDRRPGNKVAAKYVKFFGISANKIFPDVYAALVDTKSIETKEAVK